MLSNGYGATMLDKVVCEIERRWRFEQGQLSPPEIVGLIQSLIVRGWAWHMPRAYQMLAHQYLSCGVLKKYEYEVTDMIPKIKAVVSKDGTIKQLTAEGEVEIELTDEDGKVVANYSSHQRIVGTDQQVTTVYDNISDATDVLTPV